MSQVIFERLLIRSEKIQCDQQPAFGHITRRGRGSQAPPTPGGPKTSKTPRSFGGPGFQR
jgi:hypothetical protein